VDDTKRRAIAACGRCGQDERAHQHATGTEEESILVLAALGGPCPQFVVSDAALTYQRHLAMAARQPRPGGRRGQLCPLCGYRGHGRADCPFLRPVIGPHIGVITIPALRGPVYMR